MRSRFSLIGTALAIAACDRVTSPSLRDAGTDSAAALWEHVDAGTTNYNAVAGSAPDNVFIVGDQGTILHWNGAELLPEASGTVANLRAVAVVDQNLAYAVGEQGTVLSRRDSVWTLAELVTTSVLNGVWANQSRAVAAGEQGTILHFNGTAWRQIANSRNDNYYAVTNSGEGVEILGALGIVLHIDSAAGTLQGSLSIPGFKVLAAGARYGSGSVIVGADGAFFFVSKGSSKRLAEMPDKFLRAVSIVGNTAWITGHDGLVAAGPLDGKPTVVPTPDDRWLLGVYAASSDDVWIVGRSGLIMRGPPGTRHGLDGGTP